MMKSMTEVKWNFTDSGGKGERVTKKTRTAVKKQHLKCEQSLSLLHTLCVHAAVLKTK